MSVSRHHASAADHHRRLASQDHWQPAGAQLLATRANLDADATHTPANSAFTVLVNGVANAVTNVTVGPRPRPSRSR
ncbi:hypothetical protein D5039_21460 [Verminephrobacter aporrectodeae subsp. tuberculatae]|uniref:Uncharacterized protein n=1 Tax=Verminephrobacter aporrectodeae subsp. tuberculatae TaxID=1110392 RepID=A0ABT3KZ75_9BURK|nr:SwmB domain-containing protein [Verminephrobacter aporrectodeae]MCW5323620.1 hypothetical protein [Verminephrobacter aporrectodeae subsp. tuberculatae]